MLDSVILDSVMSDRVMSDNVMSDNVMLDSLSNEITFSSTTDVEITPEPITYSRHGCRYPFKIVPMACNFSAARQEINNFGLLHLEAGFSKISLGFE